MVSCECIRLSRSSEGLTLHLFPLRSPNHTPIPKKIIEKAKSPLRNLIGKGCRLLCGIVLTSNEYGSTDSLVREFPETLANGIIVFHLVDELFHLCAQGYIFVHHDYKHLHHIFYRRHFLFLLMRYQWMRMCLLAP